MLAAPGALHCCVHRARRQGMARLRLQQLLLLLRGRGHQARRLHQQVLLGAGAQHIALLLRLLPLGTRVGSRGCGGHGWRCRRKQRLGTLLQVHAACASLQLPLRLLLCCARLHRGLHWGQRRRLWLHGPGVVLRRHIQRGLCFRHRRCCVNGSLVGQRQCVVVVAGCGCCWCY